ncbi:MAG: hypothetical protein ACXVA9_01545 [Bdellovibrionales bacterium]
MKRREFLRASLATSVGVLAAKSLNLTPAFAADAKKKIADKDVLKDGQPATIANYCATPDKQPNKACPNWKEKPGHCETCQFFNKDNSLTDFKGGKYAHCQLLTDPSKPQFVSSKGWCATYVAKPS